MSGTRLTDAQKAQIVAAYAAGDSARTIGEALGVAHTTVARLVARDPVVRRRVDAAAKRLAVNEARASRRSEDAIHALDADATPDRRPELKRHSPVPPPPGTPEREAWDAANAEVRLHAAHSDQSSTPPSRRTPPGTKSSGGTRVIRFSGPTVFDGPVAQEMAFGHGRGLGSFEPSEPPRWWLDQRAGRVAVRDGSGRSLLVPADAVDAYLADGWRR